ncbi:MULTISPECIES: aldo/keto reductase family oxidoreductase [Ralstonia solanacearum species complex]|uniref:aldo/keto reductase family oxidoreductase n=1 Tax=Ralstonia solanacearum species complex TaxID=3116862 RepID=UPI0018D00A00|nr:MULTISPECIES: aldo/keto reductase family oxidoreductase [Ralstonia solanacearum species complex]MDN3368255.1 aldo/keto reductase family oxidoreductase [Ralstonia pseudosolanacearum]
MQTSERFGDLGAQFSMGNRRVKRLGYGAMQLAGPGVFGPPRDHEAALAVLREAIAAGVDHIDTSDFYGPHVTNQLIREALAPYPHDLTIVTKVGALRGEDGSWNAASNPDQLRAAVEDNLRNLGLDRLDVVNFRIHPDDQAHGHHSIAKSFGALALMQREGMIGNLGISNATATQIKEARAIAMVVCVQNEYNLAQRKDDELVDSLAADGIAYVPYFPLGGFSPLQSASLSVVAARLNATPMQVALAWLLQRSPNILLIPGTSSVAHLRENLAAAALILPDDAVQELNAIGAAGASAAKSQPSF